MLLNTIFRFPYGSRARAAFEVVLIAEAIGAEPPSSQELTIGATCAQTDYARLERTQKCPANGSGSSNPKRPSAASTN